MNPLAPAFAVAASVALGLAACSTAPNKPTPPAPNADSTPLMTLFGYSISKSNRPVARHVIDGKIYYYLRSPCCDALNFLYDEGGKYVCAPDGGLAGKGDGKCPNLRLDHSAGVVVPNPFYKP